ncbi:hypothetical protein FQR65_LT06760 [Abscondita terminalis]|nr:hypothetical protein FQR65_LT06760 [Abscondita terminalis]
MLQDSVRNSAYQKAIFDNKEYFNGKTVLDVGAGTGILSVFCAQAGAQCVYAVEGSEMYKLAEEIAEENNFKGVIKVGHHTTIEDVRLPEDGKVDIIVSEWMGHFLLHEGMLDSVIWARDNLLRPNGLLFPENVTLYSAPCRLPSLNEDWKNINGVSMVKFCNKLKLKSLHSPIIMEVEPEHLLSDPEILLWLDMREVTLDDIKCSKIQHLAVVDKPGGRYQGICLWFTCSFPAALVEPVVLSTHPEDPKTHWKQTVVSLPTDISVEKGYPIAYEITIKRSETDKRKYGLEVEMLDPDDILKISGVFLKKEQSKLNIAYSIFIFGCLIGYQIFVIPELLKGDYTTMDMVYQIAYVLSLAKSIIALFNRKMIKDIFDSLESGIFLQAIQDLKLREKTITIKWIGFLQKMVLIGASIPYVLVYGSLVLWYFEHLSKWPFGVFTDVFSYTTTVMIQTFTYTFVGNGYFVVDVSYFSILGHIQIHLRNLHNLIDNMVYNSACDNSNGKVDGKAILNEGIEWKCLQKYLKEAVYYHVAIIELSKKVEKTFRLCHLAVFVTLTFLWCLLLFEISVTEPLGSLFWIDVVYIFSLMSLLIMICFYGNQIIVKSELIADTCYNVDFIGTDVRFQKSLLIMIRRSQEPIVFTVGNFAPLSLVTAVGVIMKSYGSTHLAMNRVESKVKLEKIILKILTIIRPVALISNVFGILYISGWRKDSFNVTPIEYLYFTCCLFVYILLYFYNINISIDNVSMRVPKYLIEVYLTLATFNNVYIIMLMFYNRNKIKKIIRDLGELLQELEINNIYVNCEVKRKGVLKMIFVILSSQIIFVIFLFLLRIILYPLKIIIGINALIKGIIICNCNVFLFICGSYMDEIKLCASRLCAMDASMEEGGSNLENKMSSLCGLHLQTCKLSNSLHKLFSTPMFTGFIIGIFHSFFSVYSVYFSAMQLKSEDVNYNSVLEIPRELIFVLAFVATVLTENGAQDSKTYDTSEWIPITGTKDHSNIEPKATSRILQVPQQNEFVPDNVRAKKASNDQYLREISQPVNRQFPTQSNTAQNQPTNNFEPQLNQGEILNPFFKQQSFQHRDEQQRQQSSTLLRQNNPSFPTPVVFPAPKPQYTFRQPVPSTQPSNVNVFKQNHQTSPYGFQAPLVSNFNQSISFEKLNPGIQAINQGLSADIFSNNNNFREALVQSSAPKAVLPADTVQLVYVPVNSLNQKPQAVQRAPAQEQQQALQFQVLPQTQQPQPQRQAQFQRQPQDVLFAQQQNVLFAQPQPNVQSVQFSNPSIDPHKQQQLFSIQNDFAQQALNALNFQLQLQQGHVPNVVRHAPLAPPPTTTTTTTTTTTPAPTTQQPKKRKPHQPPLAVYMGAEGDVSVSDVLSLLKNAKTISVQDVVGPNSPQVFVGPQNLEAPEGYVKFDLPYLSSLETNRIERKVDQFPFFVAPVSYKAPPGYSKIPLPAPHVGSVVVSQKDQQINIDSSIINDNSFRVFHEQPQALKFESSQGAFRFDNQIQSSSVAPPTRRNPTRPVLTQTINQYELEQINNQFVPQFQSPEFHSASQSGESSEYQDTNVPQPNVRFSSGTPTNNDYKNFNTVRDHRLNYVTTSRPTTTTQPIRQFVEIETTTNPPVETKHRFAPRPTQHQQPQHHQQFINDYTVLEQFPIDGKTTIKSSEDADLNPPAAPTAEFPNHSQEYHSINRESDKLPVPTIPNTKENNLDYQHQFVAQSHAQNQFVRQGHKATPTVQSEIVKGQSIDPTYQLNNQFVSTQSNHHISHKLVPQQLEQEEHNPNLITSPPTEVQHFTEQTFEQENKFISRGRERPQFVDAQNSNEAVDDYKLPAQLPPIHPEIHSLINDLQDPSLRPLLVSASLPPTNEPTFQQQHHHQQLVEISSVEPQFITEPIIHTTTTEVPTTTTRRSRGRPRGGRLTTTTTYTPRRTVQRTRKPVVRTTTEQIEIQPDPAEEYNYFPTKTTRDYQRVKAHREESEVTQRSTVRPRSRTRSRTTTLQTTEQTTTEPIVIHDDGFKQSQLFSGFQASKVNPQSYMQFDHQNLQYQDSSTEPLIITKDSSIDQHRMNVDVVINHPVTDKIAVEPAIISQPDGNSQYVRFSSNLDSEIVTRRVEEISSPSQVRIQGRGRVKSRVKPTERPTTTTPRYLTTTGKAEKEEEFYGFFRPPNFNAPVQAYNPRFVSTTKRPVYISNTIQYEDQPLENSNNVNIFSNNVAVASSTPAQFIGELVTRYSPSFETTEIVTHEPVSTPRSRVRTRIRLPKNKSKEEQHTTPMSQTRTRSRGKAHFTIAAKSRDESRDEDVEGGNYPKFFPKSESSTSRSKFQITIEPVLGDHEIEDDQVPFSSIRRQKFVPAEQGSSLEEVRPVLNDIPIDRKTIDSQEVILPTPSHLHNDTEKDSYTSIKEEVIGEIDKVKMDDENITTTTVKDLEATTKATTETPKSRRRGVWKLVKRPVDAFETAESQYVGKFSANSLVDSEKDSSILDKDATTVPTSSTTQESDFLQALYKMFENTHTNESVESSTNFVLTQTETTLPPYFETTISPLDLRNTTYATTSTEIKLDEIENTTEIVLNETQTERWDLVKTSTATEISHETEICFRGKCVKSSDDDKPKE